MGCGPGDPPISLLPDGQKGTVSGFGLWVMVVSVCPWRKVVLSAPPVMGSWVCGEFGAESWGAVRAPSGVLGESQALATDNQFIPVLTQSGGVFGWFLSYRGQRVSLLILHLYF